MAGAASVCDLDARLADELARGHEELLEGQHARHLVAQPGERVHADLLPAHLVIHSEHGLLRHLEDPPEEARRLSIRRTRRVEHLLEEERVDAHALHGSEEQRAQSAATRPLGPADEVIDCRVLMARAPQHVAHAGVRARVPCIAPLEVRHHLGSGLGLGSGGRVRVGVGRGRGREG